MRDKILDETKRVFKPEFLNRLDEIIVFHSLGKPELLRIVELEVNKVLTRIKAKDVHIDLQQSAKEFLIEKGYDPQYGARPMRRAVERYLEDPLAEELLRATSSRATTSRSWLLTGSLAFTSPSRRHMVAQRRPQRVRLS